MQNLFMNLPRRTSEETVDLLFGNRHARIERIISTGHQSPTGFWYDQCENEWVTVLAGSGVVVFESGEKFRMNPGDHLFIPAHTRHRVEWTSPDEPTVWIAVFFPDDNELPRL